MKKIILILLLLTIKFPILKADSTYVLPIHFLYGSRPVNKYANCENKWFGGKLGGHVGIELDSNKILNFLPSGAVSLYPNNDNPNSRFVVSNRNDFYSILGGHSDSMQKMIVYIELNALQKRKLDSISLCYLAQSPYDYAFFGMRCGSSTYEILAQLGVLKKYKSRKKTARRIFYPRRLRKRLIKLATVNNWKLTKELGTNRRKWERD